MLRCRLDNLSAAAVRCRSDLRRRSRTFPPCWNRKQESGCRETSAGFRSRVVPNPEGGGGARKVVFTDKWLIARPEHRTVAAPD